MGNSRPCHSPAVPLSLAQGRPHSCHMTLRHIGHACHQRWSQIGVVCSMDVHNGRIGIYFIPQRNNLKASSIWTDGEFWWKCWAHFCALLVWAEPDNWVRVQRTPGLDSTVSTTPDVVTGSHLLSTFDTVVATFTVYHWWLNKPCSCISKIVAQIPGWYCVQISVPLFPK